MYVIVAILLVSSFEEDEAVDLVDPCTKPGQGFVSICGLADVGMSNSPSLLDHTIHGKAAEYQLNSKALGMMPHSLPSHRLSSAWNQIQQRTQSIEANVVIHLQAPNRQFLLKKIGRASS